LHALFERGSLLADPHAARDEERKNARAREDGDRDVARAKIRDVIQLIWVHGDSVLPTRRIVYTLS
jgi:hypothetical protein